MMDAAQLVLLAAEMKAKVLAEVAGDEYGPARVTEMTRLHLEKPWTAGFLAPLVSPLKPVYRAYLRFSVMNLEGRIWYIPSFHWWRQHARLAHPTDGAGCDPEAHVRMYTGASEKANCLYADLMEDGTLHILGVEEFCREADWWRMYGPAGNARAQGQEET